MTRITAKALRNLVVADLPPTSFTLDAGEMLAVMGPSGSGKTLLLRALADLDPNVGDVRLDDRPRADFSGPAWRRRVVYVAAESGWWAERVGDHFEDETAARHLCTGAGLDAGALDWEVSRASSGERQRLALIRALVLRPPVLLLDEPTANLDAAAAARVEAMLREAVRRDGTAVVIVSHEPVQVERLGARRLMLTRTVAANDTDANRTGVTHTGATEGGRLP